MKPIALIGLCASLALNVGLLGLLLVGAASSSSPAPAAAAVDATAAKTAKSAPSAPAFDEATWSSLRSENLPEMVARLRAAGFPPELVRALMLAQLQEKYAARRKAIDPEADRRPFWSANFMDTRMMQAMRDLGKQQQKELRELLGPDAEPTDAMNNIYQGRRLDGISPDKLPEVRRILRDFDEARADVYGTGGMIGPEQQKKLAALDRDQRAALTAALSPAEAAEFELRNSDTARNLRYQLSAFNPTEEEYRTLYKLQAAYDDQFGRIYGLIPPDEQRRRSDAQRELNDQMKAVLGPVRAADYERASDYSYRQTSQLVARLELPPETTQKVYDVQKDIQTQLQSIYTSSSPMSAGERDAKMATMLKEAETKVTAILGQRGFEAYKNNGGSWMQSLRPRPATPNPGGGLIFSR